MKSGNVTAVGELTNCTDAELCHSTLTEMTLTVFALMLSAFIIFVNSITITVIRKTRSLHTFSNIYVLSLAVTDLIVGLGLISLSLFYIPAIRQRYYNRHVNLCAFVLGINLGMAIVSSIHMALIATDRYLYILRPYVYQNLVHPKFIAAILSATWIFGLLYALLPQLIHSDPSKVRRCDITLLLPIEYMFYTNLTIYTTCVVIDVTMYTQILYAAYKQRRVIHSTTARLDTNLPSGFQTTGLTGHQEVVANSNAQLRSDSRDMNLANDSRRLSRVGWTQDTSTKSSADLRANSGGVESSGNIMKDDKKLQSNISPASVPLSHILQPDLHSNSRDQEARPSFSSGRQDRLRFKNLKFFMTVFGVYFICVTPTIVCMGVDYFWPVPRFVYNMMNLLALLNSGMNFIIFFILNSRFRAAVYKLFHLKTGTMMNDPSDMSYMN